MINDKKLLDSFKELSPEKQEEVIDFIEFLKIKQGKSKKKRQWKEIAGIVQGNESIDAQSWVTQLRQESDDARGF